MDEKRKYGHNSNGVPILFTCDMSWPILKSSLRCFNNESVEEYIIRSYKIAIDQASFSDLPIKPSKSFVQFCSSHITHTFSRCLKKYFTGSKIKFLMYSSSVLANSEKWQTFRSRIYSLFVVLLSVHKTDWFEIHFQHFAKKIEELGKTKDRANYLTNDDNLKLESNNFKTNLLHEFDSIYEERYYQQSKRSLYYKDCPEDFKRAKREIKRSTTTKLDNSLYCPQYAGYLLNNWTGLASL